MFADYQGHIYILLSMNVNANVRFVHPQIVRNADIQKYIAHLTPAFIAQQV